MNDRFGHWTVLEPRDDYVARDMVRVLCVCGKLAEVRLDKLKYGESKSCGCRRGEHLEGTKWPELAPDRDKTLEEGARVGRWTVLTEPYSVPGHRGTVVDCRCDCGTEKTLASSDLRRKRPSKSCGCLRRDGARQLLRQST